MSTGFDPYYTWLGIPPQEQPPHHYRLLNVPLFEASEEVIRNAADQRMAHVRTFQHGAHTAESQRLLNELARAQACLLNTQQKQEYDRRSQARLAPSLPPTAAPLRTAQPFGVPAAALPRPAATAAPEQAASAEGDHSSSFTLPFSPRIILTGVVALFCVGLAAVALISQHFNQRAAENRKVVANNVAPPPPAVIPAEPLPTANSLPVAPSQPPPRAQFSLSADGDLARFAAVPQMSLPVSSAPLVADIYELKLGPPQNMLTAVDPARRTKNGQVFVENGVWRTSGKGGHDVVELPFAAAKPPREYLLRATFTRQTGSADIGFGLTVDGRQCQLVIDGYSNGMYSGLDMVQGKTLFQLGAPQAVFRQAPPNGTKGTVVCAVTRDRVWGLVDDVQIANFTGPRHTLSRHPVLPAIRNDCLGISTYYSSYVIHELQVWPILDTRLLPSSTFARFEPESTSPPAPPLPAVAPSSTSNPAVAVRPESVIPFNGSYHYRVGGREPVSKMLDVREPYTVELWFRSRAGTEKMGLLATREFSFSLTHDVAGVRTLHFTPGARRKTESYVVLSGSPDWIHLAITSHLGQKDVFVNGSPAISAAAPVHAGVYDSDLAPVYIGRAATSGPRLQGEVRGLRICHGELYVSTARFEPPETFTALSSCRCLCSQPNILSDQMRICALHREASNDAQQNNLWPTDSSNVAGSLPLRTDADFRGEAPAPTASTLPTREALPSEEAQKAARQKVRDAFANLSKTKNDSERWRIAHDMVSAAKSEKDVAVRYALLVEGRQIAITTGRVSTALLAAELFANEFRVDRLEATASTVKVFADKTSLSLAERSCLLDAAMKSTEEALAAERWDLADAVSRIATTVTVEIADVTKKTRAKKLRDEVVLRKGQVDALEQARKKVKTAPDDAAANLILGKHYCLAKQDWAVGLAHLAKGSDARLAAAARNDLEATTLMQNTTAAVAPSSRLAAASAWYDFALSSKGDEKLAFQWRALVCYREAVARLEGLELAKAKERIRELQGEFARLELEAKTAGSKTAAEPPPAKNLSGAILQIHVQDQAGNSLPTPFLCVVQTKADLANLYPQPTLQRHNISAPFLCIIAGDLVLPKKIELKVYARNAQGSIGNTTVSLAPGYDYFRGTLELPAGTHRVELRGSIGKVPDFSFRDLQDRDLVTFSAAELQERLDRNYVVPAGARSYESKGQLLSR